ncbi:MAG: acyl-ACP--UDP-N-acetylglucosamine O-acyltransferase [Opitutae bacterium]|nr:acyl-ACP--UDP-N-acetylglucosamine O-acyltransferase [Opitutae bacterium]
MAAQVHPTAIVESGAELDEGVIIGAYTIIGAKVRLGRGTEVRHHATVEGLTELGEGNVVYPYAYIGAKTHDLKFEGGDPGLKIGRYNTFREYVTVHAATNDGEFTVVGDHNVILAYSHIAHDCNVGNNLVMSSHSALGGHVATGDHVNIGWGVGVHQFCRIGNYSMLSACSKVVQDVLPLMLVDGSPAEHRSVNKVGLERNGFSRNEIERARYIFKILFKEGLNKSQAFERLHSENSSVDTDERVLRTILDFSESATDRGLA